MDLAAGPTVPSAPTANGNGKSSWYPIPHPPTAASVAAPFHHICTVTLEDYFQAGPLRPWIRAETWHRFESRLIDSTRRTLEFLESCRVQATFFVGSELVVAAPDLVRKIVAAGHEAAVRGDLASRPSDLGPERTLEEVRRRRDALEQVIGSRVFGYRAAGGWLRTEELWLLDVLAQAGYAYDSSSRPVLMRNPAAELARTAGGKDRLGVRELALSSVNVCGVNVPVGGGAALRLLPQSWLRRTVAQWGRVHSEPYVMYLRPWELDPGQPRVNSASATVRLRQYRNLERMPARLRGLLTAHPFISVASHLGLDPEPVVVRQLAPDAVLPPARAVSRNGTRAGSARTGAMPVTVVVPCYNETQSLPYLDRALSDLTAAFERQYAFIFLFVDDRSTDDTWAVLQSRFGSRADCILVRHDRNRGIAAAIRTGLQHAPTEVVCSMDCDCTYDPHELGHMIPLLGEGVDVVTASPYHPAGGVRNVPGWRLVLSKTLSRMYRVVLRQKLFTYTSCFRVYRKRSAEAVEVRLPGFLGISEMLARIDMAGGRIVEYPTTLEVRVLGFSKMRVARTIVGHLGFLARLVRRRLFRRGGLKAAELEV
jgi:polysaccharide deacetylase family protein (PEP-CTERM system associated)